MLGLAWIYVGLCWPMLDARWDYVGVSWASEAFLKLIPSRIWPPKGRGSQRWGGWGSTFWPILAYPFRYVWALGGEEKAGFGAQPRDSDAILPSPGDISNNVRCFGASNFKMPFRTPNPHWHLASQGPVVRRVKGGEGPFLEDPRLFIYMCMGPWGRRKSRVRGAAPRF